jgi:predicted DNA-binding transcriptional regulator AlpA
MVRHKQSATADPLRALIEEVVDRTVERAIPKFVAALPPPPEPVEPPRAVPPRFENKPDEAFISLREAGALFGRHRTSLLRMEFRKQIPPRRMCGGKSGWLMGELRQVLRNLPQTRQRQKRLASANPLTMAPWARTSFAIPHTT